MDEEYLRKSLARLAILRRRLPWYAPPSHAAATITTNQKYYRKRRKGRE